MAQLFKSFIPSEFLDAWMRGQYVIGPRTLDYQYAGFALILRGFYRYDVQPKSASGGERKGAFGGYAAAYLKNDELNIAGFRVYDDGNPKEVPLFWKSVFSRFHNDDKDGQIKLYFPYNIYPDLIPMRIRRAYPDMDKSDSDKLTLMKKFAKSCRDGPHLDDIEKEIMERGESHSTPVRYILEELAINASEPIGDPKLRGLCMLKLGEPPLDGARYDLLLTGENYGVDVSNFGTVDFKRLARSFLEKVDREG